MRRARATWLAAEEGAAAAAVPRLMPLACCFDAFVCLCVVCVPARSPHPLPSPAPDLQQARQTPAHHHDSLAPHPVPASLRGAPGRACMHHLALRGTKAGTPTGAPLLSAASPHRHCCRARRASARAHSHGAPFIASILHTQQAQGPAHIHSPHMQSHTAMAWCSALAAARSSCTCVEGGGGSTGGEGQRVTPVPPVD